MKIQGLICCGLATLLITTIAYAQSDDPTLTAELRLRWESADDSVNNTAYAYTGRMAFRWVTGDSPFLPVIEIEHVSAFLGEEYNDGGTNGKFEYATIADPVGTELNKLYWDIEHELGWKARIGRQELFHRAYPWQRYIGTVSWRQNEQTMDAISVQYSTDENLKFHGAYINNVNRIFGEDNPSETRANFKLDGIFLQGEYNVNENVVLDVFLMDFDFADATALSSQTIGFRVDGTIPMDANSKVTLLYGVEFASQTPDTSGYGDTSYQMLQLGAKNNLGTIKIKNEVLTSAGTNSFSSPLATLHIHQGWADKFLVTPQDGLINTSINASGMAGEVKCTFEYNYYRSDEGGGDFGNELGAAFSHTFDADSGRLAGWTIGGKFTNFEKLSDRYRDTTKFWIWMQRNFNLN